jgi:hypothetical protein
LCCLVRDPSCVACDCRNRTRLITARSSSDFACCLRAISLAFWEHASGEEGVKGRFSLFLPFSPSPVRPFGAIAPRTADTALPHKNVPQFCSLMSTLRLAQLTLPLPVLFFHTPAREARKTSVLPSAYQAVKLCCICLMPSCSCFCSASAQPQWIVPNANISGNPCSVESAMSTSVCFWVWCSSRRSW